MNKLAHFCVALIVIGFSTSASAIYRCDTSNGVVFSQKKCGDDAVQLTVKGSRRAIQQGSPSVAVSSKLLNGLDGASVQQLLDKIGQPSAKYTYKGVEHWFYANIEKDINGEDRSPEILLQNGYSFQISWLPTDEINERVTLAQKIAAWSPSTSQRKQISVEDFDVKGLSRSEVVEKLGEPVAKTISNGQERWEYLGVPAGTATNTYVTVFVDFDGDLVAGL